MTLSSRLQKLEKAANPGREPIVLVEQYEGEPIEAVEKHWKREHPGEGRHGVDGWSLSAATAPPRGSLSRPMINRQCCSTARDRCRIPKLATPCRQRMLLAVGPRGQSFAPPSSSTMETNKEGLDVALWDGRSGSYPRVGYRLPCFRLGTLLY